jgi:hypothetical protein
MTAAAVGIKMREEEIGECEEQTSTAVSYDRMLSAIVRRMSSTSTSGKLRPCRRRQSWCAKSNSCSALDIIVFLKSCRKQYDEYSQHPNRVLDSNYRRRTCS